MFLSHPTTAIIASYDIAETTVSIESAIKSREGREYLIPEVPIEIPSLTPMVLKINATSSAFETLFLILVASSLRCILQGLPS